jgi:hypothetical protein
MGFPCLGVENSTVIVEGVFSLLSKFGVLNLLGTWANLLGGGQGEQRHILGRWSISHILTSRNAGKWLVGVGCFIGVS